MIYTRILIICIFLPLFSIEIEIPRFARNETSKNFKAYGTIEFGDSKQFIQSKLKENEIYRNNDDGAYIINLFDAPFEIIFIYGSNKRKPTFLKTIRLSLHSIIDSHISTSIISAFNEKYGEAEKFYINSNDDIKEYYRWNDADKDIHFDFDGLNIQITIESKHFNKLSQKSQNKDTLDSNKLKESRQKDQLKKLF